MSLKKAKPSSMLLKDTLSVPLLLKVVEKGNEEKKGIPICC
jgi:hypothetical protein